MPTKITPTCRYGHGELKRNENSWSLPGVDVVETTIEGNSPNPSSAVMQNGRGFTVNLYRCPACGYIELFDDVTDNE